MNIILVITHARTMFPTFFGSCRSLGCRKPGTLNTVSYVLHQQCKTGSFVVSNVTHGNNKEDNQLDGTHILFEDTKYIKMFCDIAVLYRHYIRT